MGSFTLPAAAAVTFTPGDILLGFQAPGANNYVYNLGQGFSYRNNPAVGFVGNIGTDLTAEYGAGWFSRTDLTFSIGGVRTNATFGSAATLVLDGDPARTVYVGRDATSIGSSDPIVLGNAGAVTTGATEMIDTQSGFTTLDGATPRNATATSGNLGVVQGTADINSWSSKVDAAPWGVFTGEVKNSFDGTLQYMDLYRILGRNDLPGIAESANVGEGMYQTTFTIDSVGNINAVPEPSVTVLFGLLGAGALLVRRRA